MMPSSSPLSSSNTNKVYNPLSLLPLSVFLYLSFIYYSSSTTTIQTSVKSTSLSIYPTSYKGFIPFFLLILPTMILALLVQFNFNTRTLLNPFTWGRGITFRGKGANSVFMYIVHIWRLGKWRWRRGRR
jgi:hypothetical protein